jgi:hypothetical protein
VRCSPSLSLSLFFSRSISLSLSLSLSHPLSCASTRYATRSRTATDSQNRFQSWNIPRQSLGRGRQKSISAQGSGFQEPTTMS